MKGNLQLIVGASAVVSARNCARIRCSPTTSCPLCWYYMTVFRDLSPNTHFCVTISGMSTGRWWKGVNVVVDGAITCQHMGWVGSWDMGQPGVRLTVGSKKTRCSTSGPTICDLRDPTPIPTRGRFFKVGPPPHQCNSSSSAWGSKYTSKMDSHNSEVRNSDLQLGALCGVVVPAKLHRLKALVRTV
jgi:hypothetical protein